MYMFHSSLIKITSPQFYYILSLVWPVSFCRSYHTTPLKKCFCIVRAQTLVVHNNDYALEDPAVVHHRIWDPVQENVPALLCGMLICQQLVPQDIDFRTSLLSSRVFFQGCFFVRLPFSTLILQSSPSSSSFFLLPYSSFGLFRSLFIPLFRSFSKLLTSFFFAGPFLTSSSHPQVLSIFRLSSAARGAFVTPSRMWVIRDINTRSTLWVFVQSLLNSLVAEVSSGPLILWVFSAVSFLIWGAVVVY